MTTTGTYAFDGVELTEQPTSGHWKSRDVLGIDGQAHSLYPALREFEMTWGLISAAGYNQLQTLYNSQSGIFFVTANLPIYGNASFIFQNYSGCVLQEPTFNGSYFAEDGYIPDVSLVVMKVAA